MISRWKRWRRYRRILAAKLREADEAGWPRLTGGACNRADAEARREAGYGS